MMFDWAELLQQYGYFAVMIGAFFEGETVVVLGAYAVQQHILSYWLLIFAAMFGGFVGDQFYYYIGSKFGYGFIKKRPKLAEKFDRASSLIDRYPILMILIMRFAWGLRTLIPMSFGVKKYPLIRYTPVNLLASFIWAWLVVTLGVQLSHWFENIWQSLLPQYHDLIISGAVIVCLIVIVGLLHAFYRSKKRQHPNTKN
ncbi:DedA family protein [Acinetobacter lanii]|uniref:DedA family protein n=1 Tax=Acinetobacter lanii TaxID=2715163 RepID=UPI001D0EFDAF|nr:DedA family protein [Acinetobacter lanii]